MRAVETGLVNLEKKCLLEDLGAARTATGFCRKIKSSSVLGEVKWEDKRKL